MVKAVPKSGLLSPLLLGELLCPLRGSGGLLGGLLDGPASASWLAARFISSGNFFFDFVISLFIVRLT